MNKKIFAIIVAAVLIAPLPSWAKYCCQGNGSTAAKCYPPTASGCAFNGKQIYCEDDPTDCDKYITNTCVFAPVGSTSSAGGGTTAPSPACDSTTTSCPTASAAAPALTQCLETDTASDNCSAITPSGLYLVKEVKSTSKDKVPECAPPPAPASSGGGGASAPASVPFSAINPTLMIPIPYLDVGALVATQAKNGDISLPYIAVYITGFYKFGVAAAAVLAVIMIMVAGFRWLAAAGNAATIGEAKRSITSAIIGLILAVGSYTALQVINPDLLNLKAIVIKGVTSSSLVLPSDDAGSDTGNFSCADESSLVNISDTPNVTAAAPDNRLTSDSKGALSQAGGIAIKTADPGNPPNSPPSGSNFSGLKVFSAFRSQAYQQQLFAQAVTKYGSEDAAKKHVGTGKDCSGGAHLSGRAVDIHLMLGGSELTANDMSQQRIDTLESIMNQAGWVRYCPEWWHFEFNMPGGGAKRASPCDKPYGSGNSAF
jgi:hypothetical protein